MGNVSLIKKNFFGSILLKLFLSYYEGHLPVLITSDVDIIQEVLVKQFANFSARKVFKFVS